MTDIFRGVDRHLFLDGRLLPASGSQDYPVIDPATEQRYGAAAEATPREVDDAIAVANKVQQTWWRGFSGLERAQKLHEVAQNIKVLQPRLAEALTREMGKPFKESMDEIAWTISAFDYYAEIGRHEMGRIYAPSMSGQLHCSIKEPLGVAVLIMPYNYPLLLFAWQAAAALGAGNAVIVKPSEITSLTTLLMMEAFTSLPAGLVQCVTGGPRVATRLLESSRTHCAAFTGTVATGQIVGRICGERFKPVLMETSGNDPFIVMPSAPLDVAVRGAAFASFLNCGQVCTSAERLYVHRKIYDEFAERLAGEAHKIRIGSGLERVDMGPMATRQSRDRYEAVLNRAIEAGAKPLAGGKRPSGFNRGWFVEPTVLVGVRPEMDIVNSESFGPVAPLVPVDDFDEAIALANQSEYGLGANIYTKDLEEAMRAVDEIDSGMVWVNNPLLDNDAAPFGGRKRSGIGRELGSEGLDQFRSTKFVVINPKATPEEASWFPYADDAAFPAKG
ncbi:MAG: aldehyde dehydrogenase [Alphaproteobacteria bacterium]|nr:aldehyde dehydrogenase [Alphaproteobacteria bacterium]